MFEYKIVEQKKSEILEYVKELNKYGKDGWELCDRIVLEHICPRKTLLTFKRKMNINL